jgi:hypothetical protein
MARRAAARFKKAILMDWTFWLAGIGLAIGAGMGLYSMINPNWGAWLVRLKADPDRPGGFAEFRGTYGGLFFFTHALPLAFLAFAMTRPEAGADGFAAPVFMIMSSVCVAAWWGTAVGRVISILVDRQGLPFNAASVGFEVALGLLIGAPLLVELLFH